jgi:hypothetical protein
MATGKRCYAGVVSVPSLPATAICPGCQTMVVLPAEPRGSEDPLICGTCGVEVPDYRVEAAIAHASEPEYYPEEELPENRIYTRKGLLQGLRDAAADRAIAAAKGFTERAKF